MADLTSIWPSILSADLARLGHCAGQVEKYRYQGQSVGGLHIDIMDGHFVPNLSMGPAVVGALKDFGIALPMEVHFMTDPVAQYLAVAADAGAETIFIHQELKHDAPRRCLHMIKDYGAKAGLAINPNTPVEHMQDVLPDVDRILIMLVQPGRGGQKMMVSAIERIELIVQKAHAVNPKIKFTVDGGISPETIKPLLELPVDRFVAGSAVFGGPVTQRLTAFAEAF